MLTTLKAKKINSTFIPNAEGQFFKTKSSEKLRKAHQRWAKARKARKNLQASEAYWSKKCEARSF